MSRHIYWLLLIPIFIGSWTLYEYMGGEDFVDWQYEHELRTFCESNKGNFHGDGEKSTCTEYDGATFTRVETRAIYDKFYPETP